ncbi:hypothetical protein F4859DRAFT_513679 [Xylaria cf. heliscus]|nr:hypothetical protein F4859DRAFT_513679 [Xylaria cf. heliscus]
MNPSHVFALERRNDNLSDPDSLESQYHLLVGASVITLSLTLGGIGARTYTKAAIMKKFDFTDCVLLLTGALFIAFASVNIHLWDTPLVNIGEALMTFNIIEVLYCPAMFCAKYVVLRQIELIFFNHDRKALAFNAIRILIWANLLFYTAAFLTFLLACIPRSKISDPTVPGVCLDTRHSVVVTGAINVVSDFTILVTPIAAIWQLRLPLKRKMGPAAVFGVGVIANVTSIVRLFYSIQLRDSDNYRWCVVSLTSWALGEFTSVILVACFPYFPRLYQHLSQNYRRFKHPIHEDGTRNTPWATRSRSEREQWGDSSNAALQPSRSKRGGVSIDGI